jgi:hypothetical protein
MNENDENSDYTPRKKTGGRLKGTSNKPKPPSTYKDEAGNLVYRQHGNAGFTTKGNKNAAGRPAVYPRGTVTYNILCALSDADCGIAVYLGEGKVTTGIRRALAIANVLIECPKTRNEAERLCDQSRLHVNEVLREKFKLEFGLELRKVKIVGDHRIVKDHIDTAEERRQEEEGNRRWFEIMDECAAEDRAKDRADEELSKKPAVDPSWDDCLK